MSKLNNKILQYKQNMCKENYKHSIELAILKKWQRVMTICCLKKI